MSETESVCLIVFEIVNVCVCLRYSENQGVCVREREGWDIEGVRGEG